MAVTKVHGQPIDPLFMRLCRERCKAELTPEYRFHPTRKWRFDYAVVSAKVAIEIDGGVWTGGRHTSAAGFVRDMEKLNAAASLGWRVLRFTPEQKYMLATFDIISTTVNG